MRLLILLLLTSLLSACERADLTFAAIPWGSDAAEVRRLMDQRGFQFLSRVHPRGDDLYAGSYSGRRALVVARMADGRLAKLEIGVQPEQGERASLLRALEQTLSAEYGSRRGVVRLEGGAPPEGWPTVPAGASLGRSVWSRAARGGEAFLILEDRADAGVVISFESPMWHEEFLRRQGR